MPLIVAEASPVFVRFLPATSLELIGLYLFLFILLEQLLYVAVNEAESESKSRPWPWYGLIVGLILPLISPSVRPVAPFSSVDLLFKMELRGLAISGLLGLVFGSVLGLAIAQGWGRDSRRTLWAALGLVGLFLGWRSAISVGLTAVLIGLISALSLRFRHRVQLTSPAWSVWLATIVELLVWRIYPDLLWWPSREASAPVLVTACLMALIGSRFIPRVQKRRAQLDSPPPENLSS